MRKKKVVYGSCPYCGALEELSLLGRVSVHLELGFGGRNARQCPGIGFEPYRGPPRNIEDWVAVKEAWVA